MRRLALKFLSSFFWPTTNSLSINNKNFRELFINIEIFCQSNFHEICYRKLGIIIILNSNSCILIRKSSEMLVQRGSKRNILEKLAIIFITWGINTQSFNYFSWCFIRNSTTRNSSNYSIIHLYQDITNYGKAILLKFFVLMNWATTPFCSWVLNLSLE